MKSHSPAGISYRSGPIEVLVAAEAIGRELRRGQVPFGCVGESRSQVEEAARRSGYPAVDGVIPVPERRERIFLLATAANAGSASESRRMAPWSPRRPRSGT